MPPDQLNSGLNPGLGSGVTQNLNSIQNQQNVSPLSKAIEDAIVKGVTDALDKKLETTPISVNLKSAILKIVVILIGVAIGFVANYFGIKTEVLPSPVTADKQLDATPFNYEGHSYHGDDDGVAHVEMNGKPWPTKKITWYVDYNTINVLRPAVSKNDVQNAFKQAWGWWAEGLDIEPVEVNDPKQALVYISFTQMDGPSGVLADSYLSDGTLTQKRQRYDSSERWTMGPPAAGLLSLPTVAAHEIGHVLGLGHDDPNAAALMRPMYTASIPREQARDYNRLVDLGYKRRPKAPVGPTDIVPLTIQLKTDDLIKALTTAGYEVTKP